MTKTERVPVTVLTGFLGSGKTTLLNRILNEQHGQRIAVIENEFGEIGVDNELVLNSEEEIFEMNNGCICCTVRGDLIRILSNLMRRKDKFDRILIETTGLADPAPVAQTFFVDNEMREQMALDGIVTVVDAKHIWQHIDDSAEAKEQIAFADIILLNKIDLISAADLDRLEARIHAMNPAARIHRTQNAQIEIEKILNIGGFNLTRALAVDPMFLEPEYPFEWGGVYQLSAGSYDLTLQSGSDSSLNIALLPTSSDSFAGLENAQMNAVLEFSAPELVLRSGETFTPGSQLYQLALPKGQSVFSLQVGTPGAYALFSEHRPCEFSATLGRQGQPVEPVAAKDYKPGHEHDDEISSVGITTRGDLEAKKLMKWLRELLGMKGADIFRMKGVLSIKGEDNRFIFQGVHMLFDGRMDRPWAGEPRHNSLIFIGRNLDRQELQKGFMQCLE